MSFAALFKKYLLRSEFGVLSEFGNVLADHGYVFDDSTFSRWKNGSRLPTHRALLLVITQIFRERGGITTPMEANEFLESAGKGYLTDTETEELFPVGLSHAPFQAPQIPSHFTGRNRDIAMIAKLLRSNTVVLLHGPAGIGKTALAMRICHGLRPFFHDGVLWCRMDTSDVMNMLAMIAYSYKEDVRHIKDVEGRAAVVRSLLSSKKVLLILDNAEEQHDLRLLIPSSAYASVLITSRNTSLPNLPQHTSVPLRGFDKKEVITLYSIILGTPYVNRHTKEILILADTVGRLPLALALIAQQLTRTQQSIARLMRLVANETVHLEEFIYEDRNLYAALAISYQQLPRYTRRVFDSLGVFHGKDFPLAAVASVNTLTQFQTAPSLDLLRNHSLLEYSVGHKYRLHPLIRQFIREKAPPTKTRVDRLAAYYLSFFMRWERGASASYVYFEQDLENILGLFHDCFQKKLWQRVIAVWEYLGVFLWDTGHWGVLKRCGDMVCDACLKEGDKRALASCFLRELCWLHYWQGDMKTAETYIRKGLMLAKRLKDNALLALAWARLGKIYVSRRRARKALLSFQRALGYFCKVHNREKQGDLLTYIGETYWLMGQLAKARRYLHRALRIVNAIRDIPQKITIVSRLGCIALQEKRVRRAMAYFQKSLLLERTSGRRVGDTFWNNLALGLADEMEHNYEQAKEKFQLAKEEMTRIGFTEEIFLTDVFPMIFKKELARSQWYAPRAHLS